MPPNAWATVRVPGARLDQVTESGGPAARAAGVRAVRQEGADAVLDVGSGTYRFRAPAPPAVRAAF